LPWNGFLHLLSGLLAATKGYDTFGTTRNRLYKPALSREGSSGWECRLEYALAVHIIRSAGVKRSGDRHERVDALA